MLRADASKYGDAAVSTCMAFIAPAWHAGGDSVHDARAAANATVLHAKEGSSGEGKGKDDDDEYDSYRGATAEKMALLRAHVAQLAKDTSPALKHCNAQLAALATLVNDEAASAGSTQDRRRHNAQPSNDASPPDGDKHAQHDDAAEPRQRQQAAHDGVRSDASSSSAHVWRPEWLSRFVAATARRVPAVRLHRTQAKPALTEHHTPSQASKQDDALLPFSATLPPPTVTPDEVDAYIDSLTQAQLQALIGHANDATPDSYECLFDALDFDSASSMSEAEPAGDDAVPATDAMHDTHRQPAAITTHNMHYDFAPSAAKTTARSEGGVTDTQAFAQGLVPAALIATTSVNALRETSSATSSSFARLAELASTQHGESACTIEVNYNASDWPRALGAPTASHTNAPLAAAADVAPRGQPMTTSLHDEQHKDKAGMFATGTAGVTTDSADVQAPATAATQRHDAVLPAVVLAPSQALSQGELDEEDGLNEWSFETFSRRFLGEKEAALAALHPPAPPPTRHALPPDEPFVLPRTMPAAQGSPSRAAASHIVTPFTVQPTLSLTSGNDGGSMAGAVRAGQEDGAAAADAADSPSEAAQCDAPRQQLRRTSAAHGAAGSRCNGQAKERRLLRRRVYAILLSNKVRERDVALLTARLRRETNTVVRAALPSITQLVQLMDEARGLLDTLATLEHDAWGGCVTDSAEFLHVPRFSACCAELRCRKPFSATVRRVTCRRCGQLFCPSCCAECGVGPEVVNEATHKRVSLGWERICRRCWDTCAAHQKRVAQERRRRRLITTSSGGVAAAMAAAVAASMSAVTRSSGASIGDSARPSAAAPAAASRASTVVAGQGGDLDDRNASAGRSRNVEDMTLRTAVLSGAYCGRHHRLQDGLVPFYVMVSGLDDTAGKADKVQYIVRKCSGLVLRRLQDAGQLVFDTTARVAAHSYNQ